MYLAGLLACFLFTAFPSRLRRDSGRSVNSSFFSEETYSYGDSAGITPDFPFNPALRGPDAANVKDSLKRSRRILLFGLLIVMNGQSHIVSGCRGSVIKSS